MFTLYQCIKFHKPSSSVTLVTAIQQNVKGLSALGLRFILNLFPVNYMTLVVPPSLVSASATLLLQIP